MSLTTRSPMQFTTTWALHRATLLWAAAAMLWISAIYAHAAELERANAAGWLLTAYSDDRTGEFSHCAISGQFADGVSMTFAIMRDLKRAVGFGNPRWHLTRGSQFIVGIAIDGAESTPAGATATSDQQLALPLAANDPAFDQLARAHQLRLVAMGETFVLNLPDTAPALLALQECVERRSGDINR